MPEVSHTPHPASLLSVVVPIYNEHDVLPKLRDSLVSMAKQCDMRCEFILVDDGSTDDSQSIMRSYAREDPRFRIIVLSRNFGQQVAYTAGVDEARGDAVVVMDADLQDPPELILQMIPHWRSGSHVVYARRRVRHGDGAVKTLTATLFYRTLGALTDIAIPRDTGDFRLIDRRVVEAFRGLREIHRYNRGLFAWLGFRQACVRYDRAPRAAGRTKFNWIGMTRLAADAISSFSIFPLRLALLCLGPLTTLAGLAWVAHSLARCLIRQEPLTDLAVLGPLTTLLAGLQFLVLGVVGDYIGRIHEQGKGRPLYVVMERIASKSVDSVAGATGS